jgi:hypothetical protein
MAPLDPVLVELESVDGVHKEQRAPPIAVKRSLILG